MCAHAHINMHTYTQACTHTYTHVYRNVYQNHTVDISSLSEKIMEHSWTSCVISAMGTCPKCKFVQGWDLMLADVAI